MRTGPVTTQSKRLVLSAVDTYDKSKEFYSTAAEAAADLTDQGLRTPEEDETVALLVSDRHDNIGMDRVARAIGEAAGASVVLDAGDDTSTGQPWEAFSLDSLQAAFDDWDRFGVAGNHDHGTFVTHLPRRPRAGPCSTARWSTPRGAAPSSASTTRAAAGSATGATSPG